MILLVDIGNTRTKWAYLTGRGYVFGGEMDNCAMNAESAPFSAPAPSAAYIGSVAASGITQAMETLCRKLWGIAPVLLESQKSCCGVRNGYAEPQRLGVDRWAALLAAYRLAAGPAVVVDCGTAMTVDVVAQDGRHLGGWIVPGLNLMMQSLLNGTAQVKADTLGGEQDILGSDTASCLRRGAESAQLGVIERAWREMTARLGTVSMFLTGGDAPVLLPYIPFAVHHEPDLVLQGIAVMVESMGASA